jgi:hypothetical protein
MARDSAARESEAAVAEQLGALLAKVDSGLEVAKLRCIYSLYGALVMG